MTHILKEKALLLAMVAFAIIYPFEHALVGFGPWGIGLTFTVIMAVVLTAAPLQAVLREAFSGQLAPQDPHDEPASKLLVRIKAERGKSPQPPFGKGRAAAWRRGGS